MGKGYKCVQNTYHFNFSHMNDIRGDDGVRTEFQFQIPALPTLPNGESKTGVFSLLSCSIGQQSNAVNISGNDGIYIGIEGLGLRPQFFGGGYNIADPRLVATNRFWIPNSRGDVITTNGAWVVQTLGICVGTGSELNTPYQLICSNPSGNQLRVKVFGEDGAPIAATNGDLANLIFNLVFSIELIDPAEDQNL